MTEGFHRIAILGLGLIGSSFARACVQKKLTQHVSAFDFSEESLSFGMKEGFIHSSHASAAEAVKDADLVVFAMPPGAFTDIAKQIAPALKQGVVVTDVGSIKQAAVASIKPYLPAYAFYVPAHPIAGSEKTGAGAGNAEIFTGKRFILTPEEADLRSEPVARLSTLIQKMGAKVDYMPAPLHDLIYAYVSHLPQIVAFAVAPVIHLTANSEEHKKFQRLQKSDPKLWIDICIANAECIGHALNDFIRFATQIYGELKENKEENDGSIDSQVLFGRLVSTCLIATASLLEEHAGVNPIRYAGGGFADMTVMANGSPQALLEAISQSHSRITPLLEKLLARLKNISTALKANDAQALAKSFAF